MKRIAGIVLLFAASVLLVGGVTVKRGGGSSGVGATNLTTLTDVTLTAPATGSVLVKSAGDWVDGQVDLADADAITGTLAVGNGGTGAASLTDGGILLGSGTGAVTALGVATNGQIPIGDGTTDPVLAAPTGTANEIEVLLGAGTIQVGIPTNPAVTGTLTLGSADSDTCTVAGHIYLDSTDSRIEMCNAGSGLPVHATWEQVEWIAVATCQNATAALLLDSPTSNAAAAACITGTNTQKGVADFNQTTDDSLQTTLKLPAEWGGTIDVAYKWLTTATSGSVAWCTQVICVADAETDDPAFPAQAAANCVTDAAKGTTNQTNDASDTAITVTGCAAGELAHVRISRDPDETAGLTDTVAADARLIGFELTLK